MIVKLTAEQIAATGAKDPADFSARLTALLGDSQKLSTVMAEQSTIAALETRIAALETVPAGTTEARVKEIIGAEVNVPIKSFLSGDEGKALIGAEASRIVLEASAATGTTPNKPSPAAGGTGAAESVDALNAAGEYEKAWTASKEIRAEFPTAQCYAAFSKANSQGRVTFNKTNN